MAPDGGLPRRREGRGRANLNRIVRIATAAGRDLSAIEAWYTQPGAGTTAARRLEHIGRAIAGLAEHPCRHPRDQRGRREFSVARHRVLYRVTPDTGRDATAGDVLVLRIFGPGQAREP